MEGGKRREGEGEEGRGRGVFCDRSPLLVEWSLWQRRKLKHVWLSRRHWSQDGAGEEGWRGEGWRREGRGGWRGKGK